MKRITAVICILAVITAYGQYENRDFSISVSAVYTTGAKIYNDPNAADPVVRMRSFQIEDIFNMAGEIRYALSNSVLLGLGSEYMKAAGPGSELNVFTEGAVRTIYIEDGFSFIPIELSAYYYLPFSTEKFKFLMGGGVGYYLGRHIRNFGNAHISLVEAKAAYGIHVSVSMDYMFRDNISIRTEMKFRDPQFTLKSKYESREIVYEGHTIHLLQDNFDSKINIDGITFLLGAAFHF